MYAIEIEKVGSLIVQVVQDESPSSPRENDNLAHIYGSHRNYTIGDGEPPAAHMRALERGGIRLLYRWLRRYDGLVAFTKLGMYDHSGVTFYPVPMGDNGHYIFDSAGWDSGVTGYAYITRADLERMGSDTEDATYAERVIRDEIKEYADWSEGNVWGWTVTKPCDHADEHDSDAEVAACPHSETLDSCWGYIGEPEYALTEGKSSAEYLAAHPDV